MTGVGGLAAIGLLRMIEGGLPCAAPDVWRRHCRRVRAPGGPLRVIGATSMLGGLFC
ncbi:MAG: DUF2065 domain-containing protein [Thiobacillus sp.]|nr:DUF2065 domain-containing protein [Thiobacillus sp.]